MDFADYKLYGSKKILDDLENGAVPNTIISLSKKVIYDSLYAFVFEYMQIDKLYIIIVCYDLFFHARLNKKYTK